MKTLTPRSRARLAVLAALPLLALSACGGGGDDDSDGDGDRSGDNAVTEGVGAGNDVPAMQGEDCDAEVALSGAITAEWTGNGKVDTSESDVAPPATYQSIHDDVMLTVASTGHGFDTPTVILLADGKSFGVTPGEGTVEVAEDGSGATIEAPANDVGGSGDVVQVSATFSC